MYENIGGKIKGLAKSLFIGEAIGAAIAGIVFLALGFILTGLLILFFGPLIAWISSWVLYGFGQLIENSDIIAGKKVKKEVPVQAKAEPRQELPRQPVKTTDIDLEKTEDFIDVICPICKTELSFPKEQLQNPEGVTCPMCNTLFDARRSNPLS